MPNLETISAQIATLDRKNDDAHRAITVKIEAVDVALAKHLGEHNGMDKAEAKATSKAKRFGVAFGAIVGALSVLGMVVFGCIKAFGG